MFEFILHPIQSVRSVRFIASQLTPENLEELRSAKTKEEKDKIETRIVGEIFPDLA